MTRHSTATRIPDCTPGRTAKRILERLALLLFAGLTLSACDGPQNFMDTAGAAARGLANLGWFVVLLFLVVTAVVWLLIGWLATRRRGSFDEHAPVGTHNGQAWILVGGIAIPVGILSIVFISSLQTLDAYPLSAGDGGEPDLRVVARQWWFTAEYPHPGGELGVIESPTEIHIPVGEAVDVELVSRDVIHSFWVPKLHGKVDVIPGQKNYIRLRADRPGTYIGQCGEYCGMQHAHMRLVVVAQPRTEYLAWLDAQAQPAKAPEESQALQGRDIFMNNACVLCHTVRGTPARGKVGPELTHLASRNRIAGGMMRNNTANLMAWVTHAQSLKPGSQMPDLTAFTGEELHALVAYLQTLE